MFVTLLTVIVMEQFCIGILISFCLKTGPLQVEGDVLEKKKSTETKERNVNEVRNKLIKLGNS